MAIFLALSLCTAPAGPASAKDTELPYISSIAKIDRAIMGADLPALNTMSSDTDPVNRQLASMAIARIHYELDKSSQIASACEEKWQTSIPNLAFYCARFVPSNLRLSGKDQEAARLELAIVQRYRGALPKALLNNFQYQRAPTFASLPATTSSIPAQGSVIPTRKTERQSSALEANINGHAIFLRVDSGAPTMLGEETAQKLGVRVVLPRDGSIQGVMGRKSVKQLGFIDTLSFGEVTVKNLAVAIIPEEHNVLGMDVLRRLGAFRLSRSGLIIYGASSSRPACDHALLIGASFWGSTPTVIHQLPVDGSLRATLLDSGSDFYLTGITHDPSAQADGQLAVKDVNGPRSLVKFTRQTARISLADHTIRLTFASLPGADEPYDYILGSGALQDADFFVDFDHRVSCILPKSHS